MSQKIIIPKGTIDSAQTNVIEIPNYLHEHSTVVVTTAKPADSEPEGGWEGSQYVAEPDQSDSNWEQGYETPEVNEEPEYSSEQQEEYQYDPATNEEGDNFYEPQEQPEVQDQDRSYADYVEAVPPPQPRRSKHDQYAENMRRRIVEEKREQLRSKAERHRSLEGEIGTYEAPPPTREFRQRPVDMSEMSQEARERALLRRRKQQLQLQQYDRFESRGPQTRVNYQSRYLKDQNSPRYTHEMRYVPTGRPGNQQWNADVQQYSEMQFSHQGQQPRTQQVPVGHPRRQMTNVYEEARQYQKPRRKPVFAVPRN